MKEVNKRGTEAQKYKKHRRQIAKVKSVNLVILIIALNVKSLNVLIKRKRLSEWIKSKIQLYAYYKEYTSNSKTEEGWK